MEVVSWESFFFYILFAIFIYYQTLHWTDFRGASQLFSKLLAISVGIGAPVGWFYLIFYGWTVVWWVPVMMFSVRMTIGTAVGLMLERLMPIYVISLLGFLVWPICAYFMFQSIPDYP